MVFGNVNPQVKRRIFPKVKWKLHYQYHNIIPFTPTSLQKGKRTDKILILSISDVNEEINVFRAYLFVSYWNPPIFRKSNIHLHIANHIKDICNTYKFFCCNLLVLSSDFAEQSIQSQKLIVDKSSILIAF